MNYEEIQKDQLTLMICTYNGSKYLSKVIESIVQQEGYELYVRELIIVDNASTDNTRKIIEEHVNKTGNIRYVFEDLPGVANARKHAGSICTKWGAFIDDDNVLGEKWLLNTISYISDSANSDIGVFNCNSIAYPDFDINNNEKALLEAMLPALACTHLSLDEVQNAKPPKISTPFGASMVFLVDPLKKFVLEGWTKSLGRTGNNLESGEDGEIARSILNEQYRYGFNNSSYIFHYIPKKRLEKSYIRRINKGLVIGTYNFIASGRNPHMKKTEILIRRLANIILFPFRYLYSTKLSEKYALKIELINSIDFINKILKSIIRK